MSPDHRAGLSAEQSAQRRRLASPGLPALGHRSLWRSWPLSLALTVPAGARALQIDADLGVSKDTVLTKLSYDPELERQKREAEKPATLLSLPASPFAAPNQRERHHARRGALVFPFKELRPLCSKPATLAGLINKYLYIAALYAYIGRQSSAREDADRKVDTSIGVDGIGFGVNFGRAALRTYTIFHCLFLDEG